MKLLCRDGAARAVLDIQLSPDNKYLLVAMTADLVRGQQLHANCMSIKTSSTIAAYDSFYY